MLKLFMLFAVAFAAEPLYNSLKSEVQVITQANWMNQVTKGRQNDNIIIIHFFKGKDSASVAFAEKYTAKATEYKGVFIFGYVDCEKQQALCNKEAPKNLPQVRLYPPTPLPHEDFPLDLTKIIGRASSFLKYYVTEVNNDNVAGFIGTELTLPKVLFFTENEGIPLTVKALSRNFNKKLSFGMVRKDASDVIKTYKVKKFPTIAVIKNNLKQPMIYDKEMTYKAIFDFLNFFSEQFATVESDKSGESKPWLFEPIPEMTDKSAGEICLSMEKVLCVILFSPTKPEKDQLEVMKRLKSEFENKLDKVAAYKFMWINSVKNDKWCQEFNVPDAKVPSVRVFNPGRRKRFVAVEGAFSYEAIEKTLEKISGGDARFVQLRGEVPTFNTEL